MSTTLMEGKGAGLPPSDWVNVMVEMERPPSQDLAGCDRGERYRMLKANAEQHRDQLNSWLEEQGLAGEVDSVSEATAFNLVFVKCTPSVADALAHAPGVVEVLPAADLPMEMLTLHA